MRRLHTILLLLILFIVSACEDLYMGKDEGNQTNYNQFIQCQLDTKSFSFILEQNIKGDVLCLQEKLHMFMDLVDTDRPGYISEKTLRDFIVNGPMEFEDQDELLHLLDGVFDLSFLVLGGEKGYIDRGQVDSLIDLMLFFNEHVWKVYKYFTSTDVVNYARHVKERRVVFDELVLISQKVREIFKNNNRLNLDRIALDQFFDKFFGAEPQILEKVMSLMFLKKIFLGGQKLDLTYLEFDDLLHKIPYLGQVSFDFAKANYFNFNADQQLMINLFRDDLKNLKKMLYYDNQSLVSVMSIYELIDAVKSLVTDLDLNLEKYVDEIGVIKEILLGQRGEFVSNRELIVAFDRAEQLLSKGETFYRIYDYYRDELDSTDPITHDFGDFPVNTSLEQEHLEDFARIVNNYHFIKGGFKIPLYHHDYYRNPNGYFEVAIVEHVVKALMASYGEPNEAARGGYHIQLNQVNNFLHEIKKVLRDLGIIVIGRKGGGEVESVTDNFVLMSVLFQYQSDGCDPNGICLEVPEMSEFLIGLVAALEVKDFFIDELLKFCGNEVDQYGRIYVDCFRRNFINVITQPIPGDGRSLADYMPLMYQYLLKLTSNVEQGSDPTESSGYVKFLRETESFARTCTHYDKEKTESVPMEATDAFAVFAGLMNVESTMLRHDLDRNGVLDGKKNNNEVLKAYNEVFEGAIKGLVAPNGGFMEKLARPIYQYLIKYGKVPDQSKFKSVWEFAKFLLRFNKRADASRTTISTILRVIGEQKDLHPFKCDECLRDPTVECVPESGNWD